MVNNVVLYDALFDVDNPDGALMTQMTAQVFFVARGEDAVLVPASALRPVDRAGRIAPGGALPATPRAVDPGTSLASARRRSGGGAGRHIEQRDVKVGIW